MSSWTRPESVPRPSVWRRFEGRTPLANGQIPRFRVQDYTDDMKMEIIDHMATHFLRDEPVCENQKLVHDPFAVQEVRAIWDKLLDHHVALVAFLDNADELEDKSLPLLAGCNVTAVAVPNEPDPVLLSVGGRNVIGIVNRIHHMCDCFKKYNVPAYLYALGLSVNPAYRGQGVGLEILKARFDLCRAVGLDLTVTVFTNIASQKLADKAGFETLASIDYEDHKDENGEVVFKNMKTKSVTLQASRIGDKWKQ